MLFNGDHLLALHESTLLRKDLILNVEPGDAGPFIFAHSATDIDDIAITCVGIRDDRQRRRPTDVPQVLHHLGLRD